MIPDATHEWESFWSKLLREYEILCQELDERRAASYEDMQREEEETHAIHRNP